MSRSSLSRAALAWMWIVVAACDGPVEGDGMDAGALRDFGQGCSRTEDCASGLCIQLPGTSRSVCTRSCETAGCPDGWGCVAPDGFPQRVCGCLPTAATEICGNGLDDDCNGRPDDCRTCSGVPVPETSTEHCGGCGIRCSLGQECVGGRCACPAGTELCGSTCVDVRTSDLDCGACGVTCPSASSCRDGTCRCDEPTQTICDGVCVSTTSSSLHCGGCDRPCEAGEACRMGVCECPAGTTMCAGTCVSTNTDEAHCGSCDLACEVGQTCNGGTCSCDIVGEVFCPGIGCTSIDTTSNCGFCGNACIPGEGCVDRSCVCDSGLVCGGACVEPLDPNHCGMCGNACRADQVCGGPSCICPSLNQQECGGACIPIDAANCAGCGMPCGGGQTCTVSTRTCRCPTTGETYCAAADDCVDTRTDPAHCGACGAACSGTATCSSSRCTCPAGQTYCAGVGCVDTRSDMANCGACGRVCAAPQVCSASTCACPAGGTFCSATGTCVDTRTDPMNCGACGTVCAAPRTCSSFSCTCGTGMTYCSATDTCVDTRVDPANCGACGRSCTGGRTCTSSACQCPAPAAATPQRLDMATPDVTALAVSAGPGGAAVLWSHTLSSAGEYWFRRVGSDGTPLAAGIRIDRITRTAAAGGVDIASNGTEWAAVWVDGTNGRFQRLAADGSPAMAMPRDISTVCRSRPRLAFSATLGWVLFCRDASGSGQLQVLGTDGMGTALPVRVGTSTVEPRGLAIAADGSMMAVYLVSSSSLSAQLINPDTSITAPSVTIGTSRESGGVVWDGQTFVVAIRQFVSSTTYEIRTLRGATLTSNTLVRTVTGLPSVPVPAVAPDRSSIVLTWASGSAAPMDLWSARLAVPAAPTGAATILAPAANLLTTTTVDDVPGPGVVFIDANQVVFGWADTRWGQTEPYAVGASLGGCS